MQFLRFSTEADSVGEVMLNAQIIDKTGTEVDAVAEIKIKERSPINTPKKRSQFLTRF
ncbi:hypothetical protein [Anabaena sp. UHCC 0399]|uniref:hypothetical protein n=1 Tax=Anabaena sp. UHCC 0399 TaxID=3110238 RepID=UPI003A4C58C6